MTEFGGGRLVNLVVGRDHACPIKDRNGKPYYGPYDAQVLVIRHQEELGIETVPFFDETIRLPTMTESARLMPAPRKLTEFE